MLTSAEEKNFNQRVADAPIVKEIISDLDGLKNGQVKLEDRMGSLEKKVDDGFNKLVNSLDSLRDEIKSDKEKALLESNKELKDELKRKRSNADTVKNGGIISLIGAVATLVLENMGVINLVGG